MTEQAPSGSDFWAELLKQNGIVAVLLIIVVLAFWHLIWKVWSAAMKAKNEEINRLVAERDKYQNLVFERLLSSEPKLPASDEKKKRGNP